MKIAPRDVDRFIRRLPARVRAVLVYGPNAGLVGEHVASLQKTVVGDVGDSFRNRRLAWEAVQESPSTLVREACNLSLSAGRVAVTIPVPSGHAERVVAREIANYLGSVGNSVVIVSAGDCGLRSPLRVLFEKEERAASLACYQDEGRGLEEFLTHYFSKSGYRLEPLAKSWLLSHLDGDRCAIRQELEKLTLYKGKPLQQRIELADVQKVLSADGAMQREELVFAVAQGDLPSLQKNLQSAFREGVAPVALLRMMSGHLARLYAVCAALASGEDENKVFLRLRPPVFWKRRAAFGRQAGAWPASALALALTRLLADEFVCKRGMADPELVVSHTLCALCMQARCYMETGRGGNVGKLARV